MRFIILAALPVVALAQNCGPAPPAPQCGPDDMMCMGKPDPSGCTTPGFCMPQSKYLHKNIPKSNHN